MQHTVWLHVHSDAELKGGLPVQASIAVVAIFLLFILIFRRYLDENFSKATG